MFEIDDSGHNNVEAQMVFLSKIPVSFRHNPEYLDLSERMLDFHAKRSKLDTSNNLVEFFWNSLYFRTDIVK
jgi:hypothetical protein